MAIGSTYQFKDGMVTISFEASEPVKSLTINGVEYIPNPQPAPEPVKTRGQVVAGQVVADMPKQQVRLGYIGTAERVSVAPETLAMQIAAAIDAERKTVQGELADAMRKIGWTPASIRALKDVKLD